MIRGFVCPHFSLVLNCAGVSQIITLLTLANKCNSCQRERGKRMFSKHGWMSNLEECCAWCRSFVSWGVLVLGGKASRFSTIFTWIWLRQRCVCGANCPRCCGSSSCQVDENRLTHIHINQKGPNLRAKVSLLFLHLLFWKNSVNSSSDASATCTSWTSSDDQHPVSPSSAFLNHDGALKRWVILQQMEIKATHSWSGSNHWRREVVRWAHLPHWGESQSSGPAVTVLQQEGASFGL